MTLSMLQKLRYLSVTCTNQIHSSPIFCILPMFLIFCLKTYLSSFSNIFALVLYLLYLVVFIASRAGKPLGRGHANIFKIPSRCARSMWHSGYVPPPFSNSGRCGESLVEDFCIGAHELLFGTLLNLPGNYHSALSLVSLVIWSILRLNFADRCMWHYPFLQFLYVFHCIGYPLSIIYS